MGKVARHLDTLLVHAGEPSPLIEGAVGIPIFQSSTYQYRGESSHDTARYVRLSNTPNHIALHRKLAAVENAEAALVTASGMAAISTTLLALLRPGDHILAQDCLYGGTHALMFAEFPRLNIEVDLIDGDAPTSWAARVKSNTRAIYVETISNPLMQVPDLKAVASFARERRLISIIDNTFASPVNFRPAEHGFDLSLHSATKYLNGHSDVVAGAVIGHAALVERISHLLTRLGGSLDPHACFLVHRGMKTLGVRMRHQNEAALRIARFLEQHPKVATVNYPGLENHPRHQRARELFDGFGGMLSFEIKGGVEVADRFLSKLALPICAPSLGGVESLITRPATTSHAAMPEADRQRAGITNSLIRFSVGLEAAEDLIDDFAKALAAC
jgi:cystathionine beta-lyase/cystathionine gamma-synthase